MEASPRLLNYIPKDPHILTTRMATWQEQYDVEKEERTRRRAIRRLGGSGSQNFHQMWGESLNRKGRKITR